MIRVLKVTTFVILGYVVLALALGGLIGYLQPQREGTLVLRVFDESGEGRETVLRQIVMENGERYLWSAKWFRGWYYKALDNPAVELTVDGTTSDWIALEVTDEKTIDRVVGSQRQGVSPVLWWFGQSTVLFAPIKIIKLMPRTEVTTEENGPV
jgi:hypothetical protein